MDLTQRIQSQAPSAACGKPLITLMLSSLVQAAPPQRGKTANPTQRRKHKWYYLDMARRPCTACKAPRTPGPCYMGEPPCSLVPEDGLARHHIEVEEEQLHREHTERLEHPLRYKKAVVVFRYPKQLQIQSSKS